MQTSCGFGVPLLSAGPKSGDADSSKELIPILEDRDTMGHWSRNKIEKNELLEWQAYYNSSSIDGCPGMRSAMRDHGDRVWFVLIRARVRRLLAQKEALSVGLCVGVVLVLVFQFIQGQLIRR